MIADATCGAIFRKKTMNHKPIKGAIIAGVLGALLLWIIQFVLLQMPGGAPPVGTAMASKILGLQGTIATVVGLALFLGAGAVWGAIYAAVVPKINWISGLMFGVVPWLVAMFAILPILDKPVFAGGTLKPILIALVLNCLWGAIVGALAPKFETPRSPAVG